MEIQFLETFFKSNRAKPHTSPYKQRFPSTPYDGLVGPSRPPPSQRSSSRGRARPRSRSGSRSRGGPREAWEAEPGQPAAAGGSSEVQAAQPPRRTEGAQAEEDIVVIDVTGEEDHDLAQDGKNRKTGGANGRKPRPGSAPVNGRRRL